MENLKLIPFEDIENEIVGVAGTPDRDAYEAKLREEVQAYHIGEAIKRARQACNMTQEQLGEKIGVQKAQISRLERGKSITLSSMSRVFKALGITTATLDLGAMGKVALW